MSWADGAASQQASSSSHFSASPVCSRSAGTPRICMSPSPTCSWQLRYWLAYHRGPRLPRARRVLTQTPGSGLIWTWSQIGKTATAAEAHLPTTTRWGNEHRYSSDPRYTGALRPDCVILRPDGRADGKTFQAVAPSRLVAA